MANLIKELQEGNLYQVFSIASRAGQVIGIAQQRRAQLFVQSRNNFLRALSAAASVNSFQRQSPRQGECLILFHRRCWPTWPCFTLSLYVKALEKPDLLTTWQTIFSFFWCEFIRAGRILVDREVTGQWVISLEFKL